MMLRVSFYFTLALVSGVHGREMLRSRRDLSVSRELAFADSTTGYCKLDRSDIMAVNSLMETSEETYLGEFFGHYYEGGILYQYPNSNIRAFLKVARDFMNPAVDPTDRQILNTLTIKAVIGRDVSLTASCKSEVDSAVRRSAATWFTLMGVGKRPEVSEDVAAMVEYGFDETNVTQTYGSSIKTEANATQTYGSSIKAEANATQTYGFDFSSFTAEANATKRSSVKQFFQEDVELTALYDDAAATANLDSTFPLFLDILGSDANVFNKFVAVVLLRNKILDVKTIMNTELPRFMGSWTEAAATAKSFPAKYAAFAVSLGIDLVDPFIAARLDSAYVTIYNQVLGACSVPVPSPSPTTLAPDSSEQKLQIPFPSYTPVPTANIPLPNPVFPTIAPQPTQGSGVLPTAAPTPPPSDNTLPQPVVPTTAGPTPLPTPGPPPAPVAPAPTPVQGPEVDEIMPVIAVIDVDGPSDSELEGSWTSFRIQYPNRPFCLLEVRGSGNIFIPSQLLQDSNVIYRKVEGDRGDFFFASDWFDLCHLYLLGGAGKGSTIPVRSVALLLNANADSVKASYANFMSKLETYQIERKDAIRLSDNNWIDPLNRSFLDTPSGNPPSSPPVTASPVTTPGPTWAAGSFTNPPTPGPTVAPVTPSPTSVAPVTASTPGPTNAPITPRPTPSPTPGPISPPTPAPVQSSSYNTKIDLRFQGASTAGSLQVISARDRVQRIVTTNMPPAISGRYSTECGIDPEVIDDVNICIR